MDKFFECLPLEIMCAWHRNPSRKFQVAIYNPAWASCIFDLILCSSPTETINSKLVCFRTKPTLWKPSWVMVRLSSRRKSSESKDHRESSIRQREVDGNGPMKSLMRKKRKITTVKHQGIAGWVQTGRLTGVQGREWEQGRVENGFRCYIGRWLG